MINEKSITPLTPVYNIPIKLNNGKQLTLAEFKGRKILLVNTASNCGYTGQYNALQEIYERYNDRLIVIGFPANDFAEQEKGSDEEIGEFCRVNFGVTFPLAAKSTVVKGPSQHPVFQWLTNHAANGWNDEQPGWNFTKYLIEENGRLEASFGPAISPDSEEILKYLEK